MVRTFIKEAGPQITLSEDPAVQSQELMTALLNNFPFLGAYQIDLVPLGMDQATGYGYGYFLAYMKQPVPLGGTEYVPNTPTPPTKQVRIPYVISKRKLKPVAVMLDVEAAKMVPLSQRRLQATLFLPQGATTSALEAPITAGWSPMPHTLMTPYDITTTKVASSISSAVGRTISPIVKEEFVTKLASDSALRYGIATNPAFNSAVSAFVTAPSKTAAEIRTEMLKELPTDAVLVEKTANGYSLQIGTTYAYEPNKVEFTLKDQVRIPEKMRKEADDRGYSVVSRNIPIFEDERIPELVKTSGVYEVGTSSGSEPALVFTTVTNLDGTPTDFTLVKTAGGHAFTEKLYGIPCTRVDNSIKIPAWSDLPRGLGVFIKEASATLPLTIKFYEHAADGRTYAHFDSSFESGKILVSPKIKDASGLVKMGQGTYAISPQGLTQFLPLGKKTTISENPEVVTKLANASREGKEVSITHRDGEFTLSGSPVAPLDTRFVSEPEAVFYLGMVGVDPAVSRIKLANARSNKQDKVFAPRTIRLASDQWEFAKKAAEGILSFIPEKDSSDIMLKIAAVLQDTKTVDAILGLNFLTPENVSLFVDNLPTFEETLSKLCELLIATQMGLNDIPESAVSRAIASLDTVVSGLELLRLRVSQNDATGGQLSNVSV